jgi:hypothetical protein
MLSFSFLQTFQAVDPPPKLAALADETGIDPDTGRAISQDRPPDRIS